MILIDIIDKNKAILNDQLDRLSIVKKYIMHNMTINERAELSNSIISLDFCEALEIIEARVKDSLFRRWKDNPTI